MLVLECQRIRRPIKRMSPTFQLSPWVLYCTCGGQFWVFISRSHISVDRRVPSSWGVNPNYFLWTQDAIKRVQYNFFWHFWSETGWFTDVDLIWKNRLRRLRWFSWCHGHYNGSIDVIILLTKINPIGTPKKLKIFMYTIYKKSNWYSIWIP